MISFDLVCDECRKVIIGDFVGTTSEHGKKFFFYHTDCTDCYNAPVGKCSGCNGTGWERFTDTAGSTDERPCDCDKGKIVDMEQKLSRTKLMLQSAWDGVK